MKAGKATITFDLSSEEDRKHFKAAMAAMDMASFIWEFQQHMRSIVKYGEPSTTAVEDLYDEWHRLKEESIPEFEDFYF